MVRSDFGADEPVDLPDLSRLAGPDQREGPIAALRRLAIDLGLTPRTAAVALAVVVVVIAGAWWWWHEPPASAAETAIPLASSIAPSSATTVGGPVGEVIAHAAGAVVEPGVYTLAAGSRVADLIEAAGGPAPQADLDRVNLAAPLGDGAQIHLPRLGEPTVVAPVGGAGVAEGGSALVDLNTAGADALETLPGIGPATSAAILQHRTDHGPFASVDDLIAVPGIGDAKLAAVMDLVTV